MSSHKQTQQYQTRVIRWFGAMFLVLIGIFIGSIMNQDDTQSTVVRAKAATPIYAKTTMDIASEFECACGSCDEPDLIACTCPTAIQEKSAIQDMLNKGYERDKVIDTIEAMFGSRKT